MQNSEALHNEKKLPSFVRERLDQLRSKKYGNGNENILKEKFIGDNDMAGIRENMQKNEELSGEVESQLEQEVKEEKLVQKN